ncbi:MAG: hypothetical protein PHZ00_05530 [Candidatus Peribacteraceae bacterium]|nr:hypothetical protein [Candidatus Peribacteraceae bacterium]
MTDDTMKPVQDRIKKIVENEKLLNEKSVKDRKDETDRRDAERRKEEEKLAALQKEEASEISANSRRNAASQETLRRDGEVVHLSEEIQRGFIDEVRRHEAAEKKLGEQATALESKLRTMKGARPS